MSMTRFRATMPAWALTLALLLSACGYKGDLQLPGQDGKQTDNAAQSGKTP